MSVDDVGLQPQRTALAWSRTGLSVFVNALIVLRTGAVAEQPAILGLGFFLLLAAASSVVFGIWRMRHLGSHGSRSAPPWILMLATLWVAWIACLAGVASIAVSL
jgi:uncharacterized protein DUF202